MRKSDIVETSGSAQSRRRHTTTFDETVVNWWCLCSLLSGSVAPKYVQYIQVSILQNGDKQGIDGRIFNRKSISSKITHPQSLNLIQIEYIANRVYRMYCAVCCTYTRNFG